ncbi:nitroreductase [Janthinobacterium sp. SUN033]|uniref:nitroreductase n=1 Tax=Janthinobacterium sp. SUN033 TaxID=3002439 RepID=UPI0025B01F86|nr:nitroreductase [Janthinobacterium sp. SUN033]MDN2677509.1 nitroreductase [Janthinobacterium sp. SUN033]
MNKQASETRSAQQAVDSVILSRRSIRAFLPTPVAQDEIVRILEVAARAPSGANMQPWKVYVLSGEARLRLSQRILAAYAAPKAPDAPARTASYIYYPRQWTAPFIERRRKIGLDLYQLLGLERGDTAGMAAQHGRNFQFFDAPVGLIFTIERVLEQGSWLDYGMFLQNIMLAARARGLDTCPQAAFIHYHDIIRDELGVPAGEMVVCGMALGYADPDKVENRLNTEREPLAGFVKFMDK